MWRYPVKSLGGEQIEAGWADEGAVQDGDGKLGSGKNTRRFKRISGLLDLSARYPAAPGPARTGPPVITGPDGATYPVAPGAADESCGASPGCHTSSAPGNRNHALRRGAAQPGRHGHDRLARRATPRRAHRCPAAAPQPRGRHRGAVHRGGLARPPHPDRAPGDRPSALSSAGSSNGA